MSLQSSIDQMVETYDDPDFDPNADAADGVTSGMVLMKDMRDALERLSARVCRDCEGCGFVPNPHAAYSEDYAAGRATGVYSTNDPEEIDCPTCGGVGFAAPKRITPKRLPEVYDASKEPF